MNWTEILYPVAWLWKPKLYLTFLFFVAAAYLLIVFNWYYSDGDQAGYLLKVSRKGWVCKTYEGELAITTCPALRRWSGTCLSRMTQWGNNSQASPASESCFTTRSSAISPRPVLVRPPTLWTVSRSRSDVLYGGKKKVRGRPSLG